MKIKFLEDKFLDGKLVYEAGKVYEIKEDGGSAWRWLKRGGIEVKDMEHSDKKEAKSNKAKDLKKSKVDSVQEQVETYVDKAEISHVSQVEEASASDLL